jgi:hypothetical protein
MWPKLLVGLLTALGIYLIFRKITGTTKTKAPENILNSFDAVFGKSQYPYVKDNWLAVSKMETAAWTSNLFVNAFNLWGMKLPKKRITTAESQAYGTAGRNNLISYTFAEAKVGKDAELNPSFGWAKYPSLTDAVQDIILWMDYTKFPKGRLSLQDHIAEMKKRGYFEESTDYYLNAVKAWQTR